MNLKATVTIFLPTVVAGLGWMATEGGAVTLPPSAVLPPATLSDPGFVVHTAQASSAQPVVNNFFRALRQINGTLTDAGGNIVTNVAIPGPEPGGAYYVDSLNFEKEGVMTTMIDPSGIPLPEPFYTGLFPGIPGAEFRFTQFACEAVGIVQLDAGDYVLGLCAGASRTDVSDDDGCVVFVGLNPRDYFATRIAEFGRGPADARLADQHIENQIPITVSVAGAYPFRVLYWQQDYGANLQLYLVNKATQQRIFINDPVVASGPRAFRNTTVAAFNAPFVAEASPIPASAGNSPASSVEVTLLDGPAASVNLSSIQLVLNGVPVIPQAVSREGARTLIRYTPGVAVTQVDNLVQLRFTDSLGAAHSREWSFATVPPGAPAVPIAGQWDFDQGDLSATIGAPLAYFDPTYDGPTGCALEKTRFGTCTDFGVPTINGQEAIVMQVPGEVTRRLGYVMKHGISPNGGGTLVNQYTLIMDVLVEETGTYAASLLQIDSTDNLNDGDLFWQIGQVGQGNGGYLGYATATAGAWHRIALAYDEAANPPVVAKFVDGTKQGDWTANQGLDNPRRALKPTAILFADGDQDERRKMWVNSIQIRAGRLSETELYALGGPDARGIPATLPQTTVSGQWDFNLGDLGASIGSSLAYLNPDFDSPQGTNANLTTFGLCSETGAPLIDGADARVMVVPGDIDRRFGYVMDHRIAPNGGGALVNQYTLIMDVLVDTYGPVTAALLQINSPGNTDGPDLVWTKTASGPGGGIYSGRFSFSAGEWHRLALAYNALASPPVVTKYVDGIFQDEWIADPGLDNPQRALQPTAILFADGTESARRKMWVNSIQIRSVALSRNELALLGLPSGAGIPVFFGVAREPRLWRGVIGDRLILNWPVDLQGYVLETAEDPAAGPWITVNGVSNNSVTLALGAGRHFYRLHKQ